MTVKVCKCWAGGDRHYFRMEWHNPYYNRETFSGDTWNRETASRALDLLEKVYGLDRKKVRFVHH